MTLPFKLIPMQTIKAIVIGQQNEIWNFEFTKVATMSIEKYFVQGESNNSQKVAFEMRKEFSRWKVLPPVPYHVSVLEEKLCSQLESGMLERKQLKN